MLGLLIRPNLNQKKHRQTTTKAPKRKKKIVIYFLNEIYRFNGNNVGLQIDFELFFSTHYMMIDKTIHVYYLNKLHDPFKRVI